MNRILLIILAFAVFSALRLEAGDGPSIAITFNTPDSLNRWSFVSTDIGIISPFKMRIPGFGLTYSLRGSDHFGYQLGLSYWRRSEHENYPWSIQILGMAGRYISQGSVTVGLSAGLAIEKYKTIAGGFETGVQAVAELSLATELSRRYAVQGALQQTLPIFPAVGWVAMPTCLKLSLQYRINMDGEAK